MSEKQSDFDQETDWESVFESPGQGFIALVEQAQTVKSLQQCTGLIIDQLFTRKNDEVFRTAYHTALNEFFPTDDDDSVDVSFSKKRVTALLRDIKQHRQRKAAEHAAQSAINPDIEASGSGEIAADKRTSKEPPSMPGIADPDDQKGDDEKTTAVEKPAKDMLEIFADLFCNVLGERFKALYDPTEQNREDGDRLPFILSEEFAKHFDEIVRHRLIPGILKSSRGLEKMILEKPEDQRRTFLRSYMESRNGRQVLWEKWQDAWKEKTQQKPLPPKPKGKKKKNLKDLLSLKKEKKIPAWKREKTPEEWQAAVTEIKTRNKKAAVIWAEIAKDTGDWLPPEEADGKLLMDMFARSIKGLQKQNEGLCQIVRQGDNVSRLLTAFARGKDIDLALLAACYQNPESFIGKKSALKDMMFGYTQKEVDQDFAMISRYLSKHF